MIGLRDYARIKNNYCICYFGYADEYLLQLKLTRPFMEKAYPGLNIYIGCKDISFSVLEGCEKVLRLSEIKVKKPEFAHILELKCDGINHPVEDFLEGLDCSLDIEEKEINENIIINESTFPTKPMTDRQLKILERHVKGRGVVAGIESLALFEAASRGIPTILVPTGVGTRFYKKMFTRGEILEIGG